MSEPSIVLICTGLGHLKRGFEMYIATLGEQLGNVEIWCGGKYNSVNIKTHTIPNINRNCLFNKLLLFGNSNLAFRIEQLSFALGLIPRLVKSRPTVLYLGEYQLYCHLYKIRRLFGLKYSLVLYTGGQAIPGLFDSKKDFVHHVTDVYLPACSHLPPDQQFLIPHFIDTNFYFDQNLSQDIRTVSAGKKIVLSVGLLDCHIKRMDFLIKALLPLKENIFPIFLGEPTDDTPIIKKMLIDNFGNDGFIMKKVEHNELGTWYRSADIFVLSSLREAFGLAMVEALYFGLPVVCNDFAEAHFVLKEHGMYLDMQNVDALTKALQLQHDENKSAQLKLERKLFVEKNYSWGALKNQYLTMFKKFTSLKTDA